MSLADGIVKSARACLGTKFRHQGRIPGVGLDCAGLAVVAMRENGVQVRDLINYGKTPHDGLLKSVLDMQPGLYEIPALDASYGDVLLIRFGKEPTHIAICSGEDMIIHAYEPSGFVVEHRIQDEMKSKVVAAYRVKS